MWLSNHASYIILPQCVETTNIAHSSVGFQTESSIDGISDSEPRATVKHEWACVSHDLVMEDVNQGVNQSVSHSTSSVNDVRNNKRKVQTKLIRRSDGYKKTKFKGKATVVRKETVKPGEKEKGFSESEKDKLEGQKSETYGRNELFHGTDENGPLYRKLVAMAEKNKNVPIEQWIYSEDKATR